MSFSLFGFLIFGPSISTSVLDYGKHRSEIAKHRASLKGNPCDRQSAIRLAHTLFRAGANQEIIDETDRFSKNCGQADELTAARFEALKAMGKPAEAILEVTKLIEATPTEYNYWAWRGLVYETMGHWDKAVEDYEKSLKLQPNLGDVPLNLASAYERINQPCKAAAALQKVLGRYSDASNAEAIFKRVEALSEQGHCPGSKRVKSDSKAVVLFRPGSSSIAARATVNGTHSADFVVDTGATYVTITPEMARRLGIYWKPLLPVTLQTANGLVSGWLTTVDSIEVNGLTAKKVLVAIIDQSLGTEGLLGLSFLSQFKYEVDHTDGKLVLVKR